MAEYTDTYNHAQVPEKPTRNILEVEQQKEESSPNIINENTHPNNDPRQTPIGTQHYYPPSSSNSQLPSAKPISTYLSPTWSTSDQARWMTPHVHEQQKHSWHCDTLGMETRHVHDDWGFSSAGVSRAASPKPPSKGEEKV